MACHSAQACFTRFEHWLFTFPLHVCDFARLLRHRFKAAPPRNSDAIIALVG
jgi:hypothetical protein